MGAIERKTPPLCPHEAEFGEGVQWPDDVSLQHFDTCLTPAGRMALWNNVRDMADRATTCTLQDHEGLQARVHQAEAAVRVQDEYIRQQTAKLRELEAYCHRGASTQYTPVGAARLVYKIVEQRVQGILGLVVSEETPLT